MKKLLLVFVLSLSIYSANAINDLLAHYPLISDNLDITGNNDPITRENAPFQDGGVYCNGAYSITTLLTPQINNFSFSSLSVSFDFKADTLMTKPVIVCGTGYRWLALYLDINGTVKMKYNNNNYEPSATTYNPGQWYSARITYDGTTANIYIDEILAVTKTVALTYSVNDTRIGVSDLANGKAFKGVIKNLKITNSASYSIEEPNIFKLDFFPNPIINQMYINGIDKGASVCIYNINGKIIDSFPFNNEPIQLDFLSRGLYFIRIDNKKQVYQSTFLKQ